MMLWTIGCHRHRFILASYRTLFFVTFVLHLLTLLIGVAHCNESLGDLEEAALRTAAESVEESVVQVRTIGGLDVGLGAILIDSPTTGLIVSSDGFIVSSAFNFVQQPTSIIITFASGKQAPAELVATDHSRMLVLLKVPGVSDLSVPKMTPASEIRPGQWAVAVGRVFRPDRVNISVGIVSAVNRIYGKAIQTDAAVSMANYGGPLVDIHGRVLGVIVPMAPQGTSEVAGVEWYDSGIGFAVPLESMSVGLERMKQGQDQRSGILGIGMSAGNPLSSPADLVAVRPDSPAGQAGLRKGDRIIEVDGKTIGTQNDLRFALGPRYGGESVRIVAARGDERLERIVELVGDLPPFRHAFLGVLPVRPAGTAPDGGFEEQEIQKTDDADGEPVQLGVGVRLVCENSPAAKAGIELGDRILQISGTKVDSIEDALGTLNNLAPGNDVTLRLVREDSELDVSVSLSRMPSAIPSELPTDKSAKLPGATLKGEIIELKLPEFPHECKVYVPASHTTGLAQGLLLILHAPDESDMDGTIKNWRSLCDRDGLLLVVPTAVETGRWERTELEYLRRLTERILAQYKIDRNRVVVYGESGGGTMAWLLGLSGRELFRGIATVDAPLPRQVKVPPNEPSPRLAIFAAIPSSKDSNTLQAAEGLQKVADAGYIVSTTVAISGNEARLTSSQREELARWIDLLDRF